MLIVQRGHDFEASTRCSEGILDRERIKPGTGTGNKNFLIRVVANGRFFFDIIQLPLLEALSNFLLSSSPPTLKNTSHTIWLQYVYLNRENKQPCFIFISFIYLFIFAMCWKWTKRVELYAVKAKQRTEKCKVSQHWRELANWVLVFFYVTCLHEVDNYFYILNTLLFWRTFALRRLLRRYSWEEFKPSSKVEMSRIY